MREADRGCRCERGAGTRRAGAARGGERGPRSASSRSGGDPRGRAALRRRGRAARPDDGAGRLPARRGGARGGPAETGGRRLHRCRGPHDRRRRRERSRRDLPRHRRGARGRVVRRAPVRPSRRGERPRRRGPHGHHPVPRRLLRAAARGPKALPCADLPRARSPIPLSRRAREPPAGRGGLAWAERRPGAGERPLRQSVVRRPGRVGDASLRLVLAPRTPALAHRDRRGVPRRRAAGIRRRGAALPARTVPKRRGARSGGNPGAGGADGRHARRRLPLRPLQARPAREERTVPGRDRLARDRRDHRGPGARPLPRPRLARHGDAEAVSGSGRDRLGPRRRREARAGERGRRAPAAGRAGHGPAGHGEARLPRPRRPLRADPAALGGGTGRARRPRPRRPRRRRGDPGAHEARRAFPRGRGGPAPRQDQAAAARHLPRRDRHGDALPPALPRPADERRDAGRLRASHPHGRVRSAATSTRKASSRSRRRSSSRATAGRSPSRSSRTRTSSTPTSTCASPPSSTSSG